MRRWLAIACAGALLAFTNAARAEESWCAAELETLPGDVCHHATTRSDGRRTLVIFLHGLIQQGSGWQYDQQRGMKRMAERFGFSVLMPKGRLGATRSGKADMIAWPTSHEAQKRMEDEIVAEWQTAREFLEEREGKPFDEVFVMGFSNGGYYATSLAMRGRLEVDGYAVFAGGSGQKYLRLDGKHAERRRPVFVAIAGKDKTTVKDGRQLARMLRELRWPHKAEERRVGHAVTDAHLEHALTYLRGMARKKS